MKREESKLNRLRSEIAFQRRQESGKTPGDVARAMGLKPCGYMELEMGREPWDPILWRRMVKGTQK